MGIVWKVRIMNASVPRAVCVGKLNPSHALPRTFGNGKRCRRPDTANVHREFGLQPS